MPGLSSVTQRVGASRMASTLVKLGSMRHAGTVSEAAAAAPGLVAHRDSWAPMPPLLQAGARALVVADAADSELEEVAVVNIPPDTTAMPLDWHVGSDLHTFAWRVASPAAVLRGDASHAWSRPLALQYPSGGTCHAAVPVLETGVPEGGDPSSTALTTQTRYARRPLFCTQK